MFDCIAEQIIDQKIYVQDICLTIRRLDLIHPQISGNKFFKLKYNFLQAKQQGYQKILTFGGAYSNHIAATAFAAQQFGFKSLGFIRGEELNASSNLTLTTATHLGMKLQFISREQYREKNSIHFQNWLKQNYADYYIIPEGGTNQFAIEGCKEILKPNDQQFDLICCAVGTGGTITGLIEASQSSQFILGFSALKGQFLSNDVAQSTSKRNWKILDDYCFGGYAKTNPQLFKFTQEFEKNYAIPLEQIYTAKMMFGLFDLIQNKQLTASQNILVLHTGGLQGKIESSF